MWPVPDCNLYVETAARDFLTNTLKIPRLEVARIVIDFMRRVGVLWAKIKNT